MTDTAAVFLPPDRQDDCGEKAIALWTSYWVTKLKEAAPSDHKFNADLPPLTSLRNIIASVQDRSETRINLAAVNLWSIQAKAETTLTSFVKTLDSRLTTYQQHFQFGHESETALKAILAYNFSIMRPDLSVRLDNLTPSDTISELRKQAGREVVAPPKSKAVSKGKTTRSKNCTYCKEKNFNSKGHTESECRKKSGVKCSKCGIAGLTQDVCRRQTVAAVSTNQPTHAYHLDTAADQNVSGNQEQFSSLLSAQLHCKSCQQLCWSYSRYGYN